MPEDLFLRMIGDMADELTISVEELKALIKPFPIAYFCAEFAVSEDLPFYAGGLGVLAGDILYQASEENLPFVGVGLMYHKGYLRQEISRDANMQAEEVIDTKKAGLKLVMQGDKPLLVNVPIHGEQTKVRCFVKEVDSCVLLLLDTQVEGNEAHDTGITDRLYFGDREHRFEQEMVLGLGGYRMLKAIGVHPRLYHLNEGHSALLFFELAKERLQANADSRFVDAVKNIGNVVFTNHTLVPAGNDVFSKDLAMLFLQPYAVEYPIDATELVNLGLIQDSSLFSPTMLALRLATVSQAVSKLHAKRALDVWSHHPMIPVTNGVRQKFWQAAEISAASKDDPISLWNAHIERKKLLCEHIWQTTQTRWSENDLILVWSRRIARYKRPLTLLEDLERIRAIIANSKVPVRILFAGKPHVSDEDGFQNLQQILDAVGAMNGSVIYLQNYSLKLAQLILSGADVLINTPVRGFEACGTSGMKSSLNGVLQCTTLDGWTDEVDWNEMGWVLDSERTASDLYEKLEKEIIPMYLQRNENNIPLAWVERMRRTILMVEEKYTAARMMRELQELVYTNIRPEKV